MGPLFTRCYHLWRRTTRHIVTYYSGPRRHEEDWCLTLADNISRDTSTPPPRELIDKIKEALEITRDPEWHRRIGSIRIEWRFYSSVVRRTYLVVFSHCFRSWMRWGASYWGCGLPLRVIIQFIDYINQLCQRRTWLSTHFPSQRLFTSATVQRSTFNGRMVVLRRHAKIGVIGIKYLLGH